jgi:hypothetical protein
MGVVGVRLSVSAVRLIGGYLGDRFGARTLVVCGLSGRSHKREP